MANTFILFFIFLKAFQENSLSTVENLGINKGKSRERIIIWYGFIGYDSRHQRRLGTGDAAR